jgi:hypothetical protein
MPPAIFGMLLHTHRDCGPSAGHYEPWHYSLERMFQFQPAEFPAEWRENCTSV